MEDQTPLLIVACPLGHDPGRADRLEHPATSAGEELSFWFSRTRSPGIAEATSLTAEIGRGLAGEYLSLLHLIGPSAARVTDKQPFNFQQLGLIDLLLPKARIIHCRRHPIDTCLSMYFTYFKGRMPFVSDKADLAFAYREYSRIMDHWRKVSPSNRLRKLITRCWLRPRRSHPEADRLQRSRLGRHLPGARAKRADSEYRKLVASTPTGLRHLGRTLAPPPAVDRRVPRVYDCR